MKVGNLRGGCDMTRVFLYLTLVAFASLCWGQSNDASQPSSTTGSVAVNENQDSSAAPVDPQVAVPDAKDGVDPYGRPIEPVATERAKEAPLVPPTEQEQFVQNVKDVYFDFDRSELKPEDRDYAAAGCGMAEIASQCGVHHCRTGRSARRHCLQRLSV